ncbi:gliding motility-associated C-terminal domain-containing protein [Adhaeribacter sp. BT258]|uniref:Gliding motility-associated C-terminal domain-containing protein n=1 Tax=Adhaeribacter terrigena TaxID=2793070 RepID=A0ABS1BWT0_9BACT|nr:gliding motility-associated C-terminal domain-containing protein [Adhaeribacter terrigena]MBK0401592.1 gliding motility-associated C-terminal domain-containing protein [Adhaeribacter terrigena]
MHFKLLLLIFFCGLTVTTNAQEKQGANWFLGGDYDVFLGPIPGVHLDFNHSEVSKSQFLIKYGMRVGAVATISDRKGRLLFFTNDGYVFSREKSNNEYQPMLNSGSRGSDFSELIMQNPKDEQRYYIFTTTYSWENPLLVKEVNMRLNNGLGDVVPSASGAVKTNIGTGMAAMLHANNKDFWLVTSSATGDSIFSFPVNAAGIGARVVSLPNRNIDSLCWLKSSPNSEMLVTGGKQGVELFHFNRHTGAVSPFVTLGIPDPGKEKGYSFSFSPDNKKLYVGTKSIFDPVNNQNNSSCSILQYELTAGNATQIQQTVTALYKTSLPNSTNDPLFISDMQLAMNGKIYTSIRNPSFSYNQNYLSQINYPDQKGLNAGFQLNTIHVGALILSLPSLNQTIFRNVGKLQAQASKDTICYGDSVQLSAYGAGAERFRWQIVDGLTSPNDTLANPIVWPTVTTTYRVIASSPFRTDTAFVKVVVRTNPEIKLSGPEEVFTLAENQEYQASGETPRSTLNWQVFGGEIVSGQGTNHIRVNWAEAGSGTLRVVEITGQACNYSESLNVKITGSPPPVFYNIITPNGDKLNDAFVIQNLKWYAENELKIYNRWGVEVFRTRNYKNNWQTEELSSGVYFYRFQAGTQTWKGWLEVVK